MLGVKSVERMDQMSHFISGYVLKDAQPYGNNVTIVGIGRYRKMLAREVSSSLRTRKANVNVLGMMHPVSGLRFGWMNSEVPCCCI